MPRASFSVWNGAVLLARQIGFQRTVCKHSWGRSAALTTVRSVCIRQRELAYSKLVLLCPFSLVVDCITYFTSATKLRWRPVNSSTSLGNDVSATCFDRSVLEIFVCFLMLCTAEFQISFMLRKHCPPPRLNALLCIFLHISYSFKYSSDGLFFDETGSYIFCGAVKCYTRFRQMIISFV